MSEPVKIEPTAPHPVLGAFYSGRNERNGFVRRLFDETAPYYDRINWLFSLGTGGGYRRRCLLRAGLRPGLRLIDVATGTGLLAQEAVAVTGRRDDVIGVDLSNGMLAVARAKLGIPLIQASAEHLPVADASTDFVTMGYALRHVADLAVAFREYYRVLRENGTVMLLEIGKPTHAPSRLFAGFYLGQVVPVLSRWMTGEKRVRDLTRYYWATIEHCVAPEIILQALRDSGFVELSCAVEVDMMRCYVGRKRKSAGGTTQP
ncbi:MAG TPA: class I SAM-dependent methyltransferase [Stellaceae bacterium]|nr:class I SAM-dependent methyltransferase [Stellaceae bacterium]